MGILDKFSYQLFKYRKENHLSQEKMAERCGITPRHYSDLEKGRVNPTLTTSVFISRAIGISLDELSEELVPDLFNCADGSDSEK